MFKSKLKEIETRTGKHYEKEEWENIFALVLFYIYALVENTAPLSLHDGIKTFLFFNILQEETGEGRICLARRTIVFLTLFRIAGAWW